MTRRKATISDLAWHLCYFHFRTLEKISRTPAGEARGGAIKKSHEATRDYFRREAQALWAVYHRRKSEKQRGLDPTAPLPYLKSCAEQMDELVKKLDQLTEELAAE